MMESKDGSRMDVLSYGKTFFQLQRGRGSKCSEKEEDKLMLHEELIHREQEPRGSTSRLPADRKVADQTPQLLCTCYHQPVSSTHHRAGSAQNPRAGKSPLGEMAAPAP